MINTGVLVGLLLAVVIMLLPDSSPPTSDAERTIAIADGLRCPYCNGESIAEAPSAIARDLQDFIGEEVARGRSDEEIIDFFVATYGEQVVLDPPLFGWGLWLWLLPLLSLGGGAVLIRNRLRGGRVEAPSDPGAVAEQLAAVRQDLEDIEIQIASGDLAAADARRLRTSYEAEVALLEDADPVGGPSMDRRRLVAGGLVLILGVAALTAAVIAVADDRAPNDLITGGVPQNSLDDITNEEMELVVAENPDVVGMRLALAERYFEGSEFSDALRHYLYILERQDHPAALANVGWMTFLSGDPGTGLRFVERALDVDPDHLQAYWFLANIRFFAFDDAAGAIDPLERVLAESDLPDDVREEAQGLLDQARAEA
jgi:cytochrome c-type biogenesis protein CcmH/NrfF